MESKSLAVFGNRGLQQLALAMLLNKLNKKQKASKIEALKKCTESQDSALFQLQIATDIMEHITWIGFNGQRYKINFVGPKFSIGVSSYLAEPRIAQPRLTRYLRTVRRTFDQILSQFG
jgi:hypothetical protein